jgi:hypothetical protein
MPPVPHSDELRRLACAVGSDHPRPFELVWPYPLLLRPLTLPVGVRAPALGLQPVSRLRERPEPSTTDSY